MSQMDQSGPVLSLNLKPLVCLVEHKCSVSVWICWSLEKEALRETHQWQATPSSHSHFAMEAYDPPNLTAAEKKPRRQKRLTRDLEIIGDESSAGVLNGEWDASHIHTLSKTSIR